MTTTPNIIVMNHPTREQLEKIYDILDECFSVGRAFFQERLDLDTSYDPDTTWFATVDGEIASNVQIFPLSIRVGQAILKTGAMGSVGTDPNYRGMGLAHKILNAQTIYMKRTDYDISLLLASKHAFYEKAGWRLIPETAYAIEKPVSFEQQSSDEIIPFEPRYLDDIRFIYEQFSQNRTYTVVRSETYWNDLLSWPEWKKADCLLLRRNEKIVAYGIIEKKNTEQVFMNELLYLNEAEDGVEAMFHALCQLRPNAKQILAMLPEDHKLYSYYQEHQAQSMQINMAMWKMINLSSTFHKLQPELEDRLSRSNIIANQDLHIALQCNEDCIYLDYKHKQLSVSDASNHENVYTSIVVDERDLMTYIMFGYNEAGAAKDSAEHANILQALFPKQQAVFYLTDKF
ncbi:Acetyltransferase (GNAT) domain-containing protein [Fontibacillus panacisegetis]|uniref:Acetyltransferase (GNAT) domain-containing protein n=1 Tax=Fontibacillus panacisegetis TaxID=670482 RepID=A0A1G7NL29_9BACL|nr:GNAT family N-acetyltransferase [Fontibacillus panacisegetis]SDF74774.1 Acetyltransferase (GNAT) domain-containing protein [Fontibacillus panacisegetis]